MKILTLTLAAFLASPLVAPAQHTHEEPAHAWRVATSEELDAVLPARAPVVQERIETEGSSNTGITDGHSHFVAATVLITAGYSAHGKYSQFLHTDAPLRFGEHVHLAPGAYLIGWTRSENGLSVTFYRAANGAAIGTVEALPPTPALRVSPIRILPPREGSILQIGRFVLHYEFE